jgi:hypothetical protein
MEEGGRRYTMSAIFIVLDHYNAYEHKPLIHKGGEMLKWLLASLSIPNDRWRYGYCYRGFKKEIPTQQDERKKFLESSMSYLLEEMKTAQAEVGQLVLVGLGKLACECLMDKVDLKDRAGTYWEQTRKIWFPIVMGRIWIARSPEAALFNAVLEIEIIRVLKEAANQASIPTKWRGCDEIPHPDFSEFL